ncbi:hypothetical protein [Mesorhizobium sp. J8]|uniref:hypothetical protein n=1 Tax=Mesorhizobium sp. J8 TaxID=2777475 RepID=UPI001CD83F0C|nr:hypothetical protein [Mesorhizobium sp. J8]
MKQRHLFTGAEQPTDIAVGHDNRDGGRTVQSKRSVKDIEQMAAVETAAFLRRASITYLECCVSLMMTHLQREEVATILEQEADMLRRLD